MKPQSQKSRHQKRPHFTKKNVSTHSELPSSIQASALAAGSWQLAALFLVFFVFYVFWFLLFLLFEEVPQGSRCPSLDWPQVKLTISTITCALPRRRRTALGLLSQSRRPEKNTLFVAEEPQTLCFTIRNGLQHKPDSLGTGSAFT